MTPSDQLQMIGGFFLAGLVLPIAVDLLRSALGLNRSERG